MFCHSSRGKSGPEKKGIFEGDLVRGRFDNGADKWTREGLFLGYKSSGTYRYAEVLWFYENKVGTCQISLLEKIEN